MESLSNSSVHRDERQIGLDTDRSFVLYPVDTEEPGSRERLQAGLHELIVSLFRKRPQLSYFQGYHDIVSVVYLTLPEGLQLPCVEKLSLHRVRDSMGASLEPVVGLLRILQKLLQAADPEFSALLERSAPLPYFGLSNILTLLSHDVPTLSLIQHIFDYLLCRHPIMIVYLVAAITLSRREELRQLATEGEEGMIHSVLSSLPELYEENEQAIDEEADGGTSHKHVSQDSQAKLTHQRRESTAEFVFIAEQADDTAEEIKENYETQATIDLITSPPAEDLEAIDDTYQTADTPTYAEALSSGASDTAVMSPRTAFDDPETSPAPHCDGDALSEKLKTLESSSTNSDDVPPRPRVSLTSLLMQADALYERYPPTNPSIDMTSIMGPQSIMHTWSEDPSELPDDDEAELMVMKPELVVLPFIGPEDEIASEDDSSATASEPKAGRGRGKQEPRKRRKLRKPRRLAVQRKTLVAGAVLVLGVAMAVYGMQAGGPAAMFRAAREGHHRHSFGKEWKRIGHLVGGVLLGVGERLWH
ncbi:hypothetical protein WOLCODRAFT_139669 [Wolfiporia cocos MD-104 SS10]|uniref:Rab-GAP TBC domain-containing protein n=1 Tax=Wolfiporia cocos (strain MD-104) TaxID=742152 RepID=A0A2H3IYB5_WOLCO|nr:hypothetical protein WOLCODRAFT_139669 [Wolfiporia cocos MD-104 SS10]